MRKFIVCLLYGVLLGMMSPLLPAQQNQNMQKLEQKIENLEKQLRSVENVEKLDLQAKLAEANAKLAEANTKLINAEFDKFERGLKDSNDERMRNWVIFFVAIVSTAGVAFWFVVKSLIADRVEKNLKGFKAAVDQVEVMKDELRELQKKHVVSVLETIIGYGFQEERYYPEPIKILQEEMLLQILDDETRRPAIRYKAAEVLASRKSPRVVSPMLALLNSVVDADFNIDYSGPRLHDGVKLLAYVHTPEAYQGLKEFLNRLLTENPTRKDWFLKETVLSLADASIKLNIGDSVPLMKRAIPYLKNIELANLETLSELAKYFDIFNEPAGIKEILINHVTSESSGMEEVEDRCLELLQRHDPEFVQEWRARETKDNSNA